MAAYNATPGSRTKIAPQDVNERNQLQVLDNIQRARWEEDARIGGVRPPRFAVGDQVHLKRSLRNVTHRKASDEQYHPETYVVHKVKRTEPFASYVIRHLDSTRPLQQSFPELALLRAL